MPDGRFLSKTIAHDYHLNTVSFQADYLFTRMIPHLDVEGRMPGVPKQVRAIVCPMRDEVSDEDVDRALRELADADLIRWYTVDGRPCIEFPQFARHQKGLRKDREPESTVPGPDHPKAEPIEGCLLDPKSTPATSPQARGDKAACTPRKLSKAKSSEVKASSSTAREAEPAEDESGDEGPFDALLPDAPHAVEVLERLQHKGTPRGTAATLRTSFLYDDPNQANPDPSVKGRDPPERRDLVVRALLEMQDQGVERWRARTLAGFIRRLSNGGHGERADDSGATGQGGGEAGTSPFGDPSRRSGHSGNAA